MASQCICLLLLGAAASMTVAGLYSHLNGQLDSSYAPHVRATHLVPLAVIFAVTLGAVGPTRLESQIGLAVSRPSSTAVGLTGLLTGLAAAALPLMLTGLIKCGEHIHNHFVLSDWPLRFFQFTLILLICILPMCGLGFTARLTFALNRPTSEWKPAVIRSALASAVCVGAIAGILIALTLSVRPALVLPASSLPLLVLALIAVKTPDSLLAREPTRTS
jgi:hypothetical protein